MMKLLGYFLATIGFIGFIFFLTYNGAVIPLKELLFVLSIFIGGMGAYFIIKYNLQTRTPKANNPSRILEIDKLRQTGEKVKITLDNCEVKTHSFQQEIISHGIPSRIKMLDSLYDGNRNYKTEEIQQTYIVFYKKYGDTTYKFVSQPTTKNEFTLRRYIENENGIELYVDKQNPKNYFFDMPFV